MPTLLFLFFLFCFPFFYFFSLLDLGFGSVRLKAETFLFPLSLTQLGLGLGNVLFFSVLAVSVRHFSRAMAVVTGVPVTSATPGPFSFLLLPG